MQVLFLRKKEQHNENVVPSKKGTTENENVVPLGKGTVEK